MINTTEQRQKLFQNRLRELNILLPEFNIVVFKKPDWIEKLPTRKVNFKIIKR